jgi:PAS domain S-box-containing protein
MKILHIEDNPLDVELVGSLLKTEWPDCDVRVVFSWPALNATLDGGNYDLVLSDFTLGSFTGLDALRVVKEKAPGTPFIFVSGSIGEDRAIEALQAGAQDYVIKDRMKRLVTAVQRATRDSLERRRREEAEQRNKEQAELLNKAREAIIVTNLESEITFWNEGAERVFGWRASEVLGRRPEAILGMPFHAKLDEARKALETGGEWRGEVRLSDKFARDLVIELSMTLIRDDAGKPKARLSIGTDITAKKNLEEQFLRAQRLEGIGMLASGIAHDLNNVLSPIFLAVPMLRDQETNPVHIRMLTTLERSAERGAALVRQILAFAHGASGAPQLVQLKHLLQETRSVVLETFPKNIKLEDRIPGDLWPIAANPTQIHQVLLNLCVNARDAMPDGGRLTLRAENCMLDDSAARNIDGARPGAWAVIHVEDTGTGIPDETLARIWEPFYTTKADKGTGLGLSTVRGIVEAHKGFISLKTRSGHGTTFRVYFPAAEVAGSSGVSKSAHPFVVRGNGELVLVVDDEAQIRDVAASILSHYGYRVLTAKDGAEALAMFTTRSTEISIVVTDMNMPNLDGAALANVVHQLNPAIKVLGMSGMDSGARNSQMQRFEGAFMPKPFKTEDLLQAIYGLLHPSDETTEGGPSPNN